MRTALSLAVVVGVLGVAHADAPDIEELVEVLPTRDTDKTNPAFSFTNDEPYWTGKDHFGNQPRVGGTSTKISKLVTATSADGTSAWVAVEVKGVPRDECAPGPCPPNREPPVHLSGLLELRGKEWAWVMWHVQKPVKEAEHAKTANAGTERDAFPTSTKGADDVAKLVEAAIADPTTFGAVIAERKDVVLYGSEGAERYVSAKTVRAQLAKWKLGFKVVGGVQAGVSGQLAWFAANVDAAKAGAKTTSPYRLTCVLEKTGATWKIVVAHFSIDTFTYKK